MTAILEMSCASDGVDICHHQGVRKTMGQIIDLGCGQQGMVDTSKGQRTRAADKANHLTRTVVATRR